MDGLRKDAELKAARIAALQADADKQAAAIRDLADKLRKANAALKGGPGSDAAKLAEYAQRLTALEEERDTLTAQLARLRQQAGGAGAGASGAAGSSQEVTPELYEARLARDQAQAQVKRLKERVDDLTAQLQQATGTATGGSGGGASTRRGGKVSGGGSGGGAGAGSGVISAAREAELLSTITSLKAALERATANTTPTSKYMQVGGKLFLGGSHVAILVLCSCLPFGNSFAFWCRCSTVVIGAALQPYSLTGQI